MHSNCVKLQLKNIITYFLFAIGDIWIRISEDISIRESVLNNTKADRIEIIKILYKNFSIKICLTNV